MLMSYLIVYSVKEISLEWSLMVLQSGLIWLPVNCILSISCIPFCRTNIRQFSICYQGPKIFNSLGIEIRNCTTISTFKAKLKNSLLCWTTINKPFPLLLCNYFYFSRITMYTCTPLALISLIFELHSCTSAPYYISQ